MIVAEAELAEASHADAASQRNGAASSVETEATRPESADAASSAESAADMRQNPGGVEGVAILSVFELADITPIHLPPAEREKENPAAGKPTAAGQPPRPAVLGRADKQRVALRARVVAPPTHGGSLTCVRFVRFGTRASPRVGAET